MTTATRSSLIEMDLQPAVRATAPVIVQVPIAADPVPGVTVLEGARQAAEAEQALVADELGIELSPTFFSLGTKMLECGELVAKRLRREWEQRPLVGDVAANMIAVIGAEQRKDYERVGLRDVGVGPDGKLCRVNGGLALTPHAYSQLAAMAPDEVVGIMRYNLNGWLRHSPKVSLFRTRRIKAGPRQLYSALSTRYARFDIDQVAAELARSMPATARGTAAYDGRRASFDISLAGEHGVAGELGVGRLHRVGLRITTADDGSEAMRVRLYAERIACINCTILADEQVRLDRRHSGNAQAFAELVQTAIAGVGDALGKFSSLWEEANNRHVFESDGTPSDARAVFQRLIDRGSLKISTDRGSLLDSLVAAWEREPGTTEAAYNRAITRAAHETSWSSPWVTEELEEQAGQLLYQHVFVRDFNTSDGD